MILKSILSFVIKRTIRSVSKVKIRFAMRKFVELINDRIQNTISIIRDTGIYEKNIIASENIHAIGENLINSKGIPIRRLPGKVLNNVFDIFNLVYSEDTNKKIQQIITNQNDGCVITVVDGGDKSNGLVLSGENLRVEILIHNNSYLHRPLMLGVPKNYIDKHGNPFFTEEGIAKDFISMLTDKEIEKAKVNQQQFNAMMASKSLRVEDKGLLAGDLSTSDQKSFYMMLLSVHTTRRFGDFVFSDWYSRLKTNLPSFLKFLFCENNTGSYNYIFFSDSLRIVFKNDAIEGVEIIHEV